MRNQNAKPVDLVASRVVRPGVHHDAPETSELWYEQCPPFRPHAKADNWQDITGLKVGRLTVIGKAKDRKGFVARCDCGKYIIRKFRCFFSDITVQMCPVCEYKEKLKRGEVAKCLRCRLQTTHGPICLRCLAGVGRVVSLSKAREIAHARIRFQGAAEALFALAAEMQAGTVFSWEDIEHRAFRMKEKSMMENPDEVSR